MIRLNGHQIKATKFPDNTSQVWKLDLDNILSPFANEVEWDFEYEGEFLELAQLKLLLDIVSKLPTYLKIKYLPYGRQDKEISNNSTFALRVFAKLLNTLSFNRVIIIDPHSSVPLDLIEKSVALYPNKEVMDTFILTKSDIVCYPDKGASEKYTQFYNFNSISGSKVRNQLTGEITGMEVLGDVNGLNVLVIDDICDGGATFIKLAKLLYTNGAKNVSVFVTHGVFSRGTSCLFDSGIRRVFTIDGEVSKDSL